MTRQKIDSWRDYIAPGAFDLFLKKFTETLSGIGSVWFFALVVIICTEVVARELFSSPIRGITEITAYSLVGATFLQIANTVQSDRMTRVDFFLNFFRINFRSIHTTIELLVSLAGGLVMVLLVQASWPKLIRAYNESELVGIPGEFSFEVWPLRVLVILGSSIAFLAFVGRIFRIIQNIPAAHRRRDLGIAIGSLIVLAIIWHIGFPELMSSGMSNFSIGVMCLFVLMLLLLFGMHVGIAMILVGFVGLWLDGWLGGLAGWPGWRA